MRRADAPGLILKPKDWPWSFNMAISKSPRFYTYPISSPSLPPFPLTAMQHPTCTNTRIRSTQDAHKIFFAVQHGILPLVTRRLDADERLALRSGCVYAWEERGAHSEITGLGIERFTEGRRWSPSRVRDVSRTVIFACYLLGCG